MVKKMNCIQYTSFWTILGHQWKINIDLNLNLQMKYKLTSYSL